MARTLNEVVASLSQAERAKVEARARALVAGESSLRALREDIGASGEDPERASGAGAP